MLEKTGHRLGAAWTLYHYRIARRSPHSLARQGASFAPLSPTACSEGQTVGSSASVEPFARSLILSRHFTDTFTPLRAE